MATINTGPAAVNTGATTTTLGPLDRAPAPVSSAVDPQVPPPTPVFNRPVDRAPDPVAPGPGLGISSATTTVASIPVTELPVDTANQTSSGGGTQTGTPIYIKVLSDGTVVTSPTTVLNFLGAGVSVTANGTQANITIIGSDYGNSNVVALLGAFGSNPISTAGNITGGNMLANGSMSITGNLTVNGNATLSGNILGDRVQNGTTSFDIQTQNGNANITVAGTSNVVVFATTGVLVTGLITASGNITGGNVLTGGLISAAGNITGGNILGGANVNATTHTGTTVSVSANVTGGNILTAGSISATSTITSAANITGGNVLTAGLISADGNITGNNFYVNSDLYPTVSQAALYVDGGITTAQLLTKDGLFAWSYPSVNTPFESDFATIGTSSGSPNEYPYIKLRRNYALNDAQINNYIGGITFAWDRTSAPDYIIGEIKSKITGASTAGSLEFYTSTGSTSNLALTINESQNISATANITAGNLLTGGLISATGNVTSGNVLTGGAVSATGNVAGNYFIGNGSQLSGLSTSSISNGTSNVRIATANGNVTIAANASSTWTFDATGNLTLPANGDLNFNNGGITQSNGDDFDLQSFNSDGVVSSSLSMKPGDPSMRLEQWSGQDSNSWTTSDWATGTYTTQGGGEFGAVEFTGAANIINFVNSLTGTGQIYFSVNGGPQLAWDGTSSGGGTITFYTATLPATDPTTVTTFDYYYSYYSRIEIDYDAEEFNIETNNVDVTLSTTNQRDIDVNSSRDLGMQGNGSVTLRNNSTIDGIQIQTDTGNTNQTWAFDTAGNLTLPSGGNLIVSGAIVGSGASPAPSLSGFSTISTTGATGNISASGNLLAAGYVSVTGNVTGGNLSAVNLVINNIRSDDSSFVNIEDGVNVTGAVDVSGNITGGNLNVTGLSLSGNVVSALVSAANITTTANISGGYILGNGSQLTGVNSVTVDVTDTNGLTTIYYPTFVENRTTAQIARADVDLTYRTDDNLLTVGNVSVTGNITGGNLIVSGAIVGSGASPAPSLSGFNNINSITVSASGNVTGGNVLTGGLISATGNVTAANFFGNGSTLSNVATQVTGSWTVPVGNNTQSFTVPINNMYQLWVLGNIPNGIIVYNATVSVSNTNVPVIGQQFAWNYEGGGNILMFTSIPAQIIGTAGAISNAQPAVANTNVFTFGINNTSGNTVTVNYGWTKIS